jgi:hypothetical protein
MLFPSSAREFVNQLYFPPDKKIDMADVALKEKIRHAKIKLKGKGERYEYA